MNKMDKGQTEYVPLKLLTICMMGRDDDYTHDFIYRITTTLNHTARSISNLGQTGNVEILITDWGSEIPMSKTLKLSEQAVKVCKFIYVPRELILVTQDGVEFFHMPRALNVAIHRAKGKFILITPCDQLISQHSLDTMLSLLDGRIKTSVNVDRALLLLPRFEVPWTFIEHKPGLAEWDRYMFLNEYSLPRCDLPNQQLFGGSGGLMLHRNIYHQLGGFDEMFPGWGWSDNELGFRASQIVPHLWLSSIGVFVCDMGHKPVGKRQVSLSKPNPNIFKPFVTVNDLSWGLYDHELEIQYPQLLFNVSDTSETLHKTEQENFNSQLLVSEITAQLQSHYVLQHVLNNIKVIVRFNQQIERRDINTLLLLSWFSINHFPRKYVEFGLLNGSSAGIVVSASPSSEIYLVDKWEGLQVESPWQGKSYPGYLACMLYDAGHRGYMQFVNGEISTAVQRLNDSFVGPFSYDLALVRVEWFGASATQHICELAKFMTHGGALILTGESESEFKLIWDECRLAFPDFSYLLCGDHKTGMILSLSPTSPDTKIPCNFEIKFAGDWTPKLLSKYKRVRQFHTARTIATKFIKSLIGKTH